MSQLDVLNRRAVEMHRDEQSRVARRRRRRQMMATSLFVVVGVVLAWALAVHS